MSATRRVDAIVVGAGANGLVAATALAAAGRSVLCLEREEAIGGRSRLIGFAPGFSAPLAIEADWIPPSVARAIGMNGVEMVTPGTPTTVALPDGGFLPLHGDVGRAAQAIRERAPRDARRWGEFTSMIHAVAGFLGALYELPPPDVDATSLRDVPSMLSLGRRFRSLGRANMSELLRVLPLPAQDLADDWFEYGPLKAAIGGAAVRDIRQGPRSGGTSFVLLHWLVGAAEGALRGRPWPRAGPDALIGVAERAARAHGVEIRAGANVARILVRDDAVTGVALADGEEISAPVVLSTAGAARTLLGLVDPVWLDPEFLLAVRNIRYRGSTALVHYALDRLPELAGLTDPASALAGVVSLTGHIDDLERAYDASKYGEVSAQPHVELSVPTLRWPQLAPAGRHVLVARVQHVPYALRAGATWDAARSDAIAETATRTIARVAPEFAGTVLHRAVLSPADIERRFGFTEGAMADGELALDQILFMRPVAGWGQYAMPIRGLYLGGAGAHPGPGVFGGPGWLAARRVTSDRRSRS